MVCQEKTTVYTFLHAQFCADKVDSSNFYYLYKMHQDGSSNTITLTSKTAFAKNRPEQVFLSRLRTGHNRLNTHMYCKFKVGESEMCPCDADIMTAEHVLQHCQLHDALRQDTRPELILLGLFGLLNLLIIFFHLITFKGENTIKVNELKTLS